MEHLLTIAPEPSAGKEPSANEEPSAGKEPSADEASAANTAKIAVPLLEWFDHHGRKDLPWQQNITPYRVWVSEIMLQQTQVITVIDYYQRFMTRFPTVHSLAAAPLDDVLHLWSGLGYYSRARNLHRTAQTVVGEHDGEFPRSVAGLTELPGIGPSTAGAIASIAMELRAPILDGNVKRVLTRYHAIEGWPGASGVGKELWMWADYHTPEHRFADYTQAIMDLGATLCRRSKPDCPACPLRNNCAGLAEGQPTRYPFAKPRVAKPTRNTHLLVLRNERGDILLEQRPPSGLWGGLWTLPECDEPQHINAHCRTLGLKPKTIEHGAAQRHSFSHYHLDYIPVLIKVVPAISSTPAIMDEPQRVWYNPRDGQRIGLPAPISKLIQKIHTTERP